MDICSGIDASSEDSLAYFHWTTGIWPTFSMQWLCTHCRSLFEVL